MSQTDAARLRYRPHAIRTVFVGESPPANGTFFYFGNSRLARFTCDALGRPNTSEADMHSFLDWFRDAGFFLMDLCDAPVNHLSISERRAALRASEINKAGALEQTHAEAVVVVMKGIASHVTRAMAAAGFSAPIYVLPFPAQGHEREYVTQLAALADCLPQNRL